MSASDPRDYRLGKMEREVERHEDRLRGAEIVAASFTQQMADLTREVHRSSEVFDKRFDRLNEKVDDDVRGLRRLLYGAIISVLGSAIILAVATGLHP